MVLGSPCTSLRNRRQRFYWVNAIDYEFTHAGRKRLTVHVVVCEETWEVVDNHFAYEGEEVGLLLGLGFRF